MTIKLGISNFMEPSKKCSLWQWVLLIPSLFVSVMIFLLLFNVPFLHTLEAIPYLRILTKFALKTPVVMDHMWITTTWLQRSRYFLTFFQYFTHLSIRGIIWHISLANTQNVTLCFNKLFYICCWNEGNLISQYRSRNSLKITQKWASGGGTRGL